MVRVLVPPPVPPPAKLYEEPTRFERILDRVVIIMIPFGAVAWVVFLYLMFRDVHLHVSID